jgi:hypothetical protein
MQERTVWLLANLAGAVLLTAFLWPSSEAADTKETAVLVAPVVIDAGVSVAVFNGCGEPQLAARMTRKMRALGFDVIDEGNASSFSFPHTLVVDRSGNTAKARQVAQALGIPYWIQQIPADAYRLEEVSLILGKDFKRLKLLN